MSVLRMLGLDRTCAFPNEQAWPVDCPAPARAVAGSGKTTILESSK